jgi:colicin import membrane protein
MKKIYSIALLLLSFLVTYNGNAQDRNDNKSNKTEKKTSPRKASKQHVTKSGEPDKRFKENKEKESEPTHVTNSGEPDKRYKENKDKHKKSGHVTASGEPDMRYKENKENKESKRKNTHVTNSGEPDMRYNENKEVGDNNTTTIKTTRKPSARTTTSPSKPDKDDRVVGTDDKGRTIYEGPRGGHYYINQNGNKEYIKWP